MTPQRWRTTLWIVMLTLVALLVWRARSAILPFAVGAIFAYTLTPVVDAVAAVLPHRLFMRLGRRHHHQAEVYRRGTAVLLVYTTIAGAMVAATLMIAPVASRQVQEFVDELPQIVENARQQTSQWLSEYHERVPQDVQDRVDHIAESTASALSDSISRHAGGGVGLVTGTIGMVFGFLLVPIWMFYALRDRYNFARNFMAAVPPRFRDDMANLLVIGDRILLRYVRGQLLLGLIVGASVGVGLTLMDVPLALALGVIAGITEMIPIVGPWIGSVPGVVLVAGTDPGKIVWVILFYLVVQQLENNLLVPRVQGRAVNLHPAAIILLLVTGAAAFGFIGVLVIVPLAAIARDLFWYFDRRFGGMPANDAFAGSHAAQMRNRGPSMLRRAAGATRRRARGRAPEVEGAGTRQPPGAAL